MNGATSPFDRLVHVVNHRMSGPRLTVFCCQDWPSNSQWYAGPSSPARGPVTCLQCFVNFVARTP